MSYSILEAAPLERATFRKGDQGWPVIICQICLNSHYSSPKPLTVDGVFGPATETVAKQVQIACGVSADGIVGPATQEAFIRAKCVHGEKGTTPPGLLIGICNIESSYQWAAVSVTNADGTHDYGCTQENMLKPSQQELTEAFNPDSAAHRLAGETLGFYKVFSNRVRNQRAWEIAALAHNWPSAAYLIAEGEEAMLNKPFAFTTAKGFATALDYVNHYIAVATAQVTSWTVS